MRISVVNTSKRVSDPEIAQMVHAINIQLTRDVAPVWGLVPTLEVAAHGQIAQGILCTIGDTPDVPDAAGYHDEKDGKPYIKVFTFAGASALVGADALSVTLSHEVIELALNPSANLWADGRDGADYCREGCDAPEAQTYAIDGVAVSNFVHPAFFDPQALPGSRFDHLEHLHEPFETPPGGYQLRRAEPGRVSQVFGKHRDAGYDVREIGNGVALVFGAAYPERRKAAKIARAVRRHVDPAVASDT